MASLFISGGISGAITNPYSEEADKHAKLFYAEMRKRHDDIAKIAKNTDFTKEQIALIKNYLFIAVHELEDGKYRQFDESFQIAQSWQRLSDDPERIQPHDLTLLNHELLEIRLVQDGMSQSEAHRKASETYNYSKESDLFYSAFNKEHETINKKITGAINYDDIIEIDDDIIIGKAR